MCRKSRRRERPKENPTLSYHWRLFVTCMASRGARTSARRASVAFRRWEGPERSLSNGFQRGLRSLHRLFAAVWLNWNWPNGMQDQEAASFAAAGKIHLPDRALARARWQKHDQEAARWFLHSLHKPAPPLAVPWHQEIGTPLALCSFRGCFQRHSHQSKGREDAVEAVMQHRVHHRPCASGVPCWHFGGGISV